MSDIQTQLPVKLTDNTNTALVTAVAGGALQVDVVGIVASKVDDTAFVVATDSVLAIGAMADETAPDSVNEGDIGIPRMTLTRLLKTKMIGDNAGADVNVAVNGSGRLQVDVVSGGGGGTAYVDDSAFVVGTDNVTPMGALVDETSPDSADEGDVGIPRMTADRKLLFRLVGATDSNRADVDASGRLSVNIAASAATVTVSDTATKVDDAAFTVATDRVMPMGAMADETSPDSVDEGDVGIPRMTLTRLLKTKMIGDNAGSDVNVAVNGSGRLQVDVVTGAATTKIDDAAFTVAVDAVVPFGALVDEVTPDSADEGDVGIPRMTADRKILTRIVGATDSNRLDIDASGRALVSIGAVTTTVTTSDTATKVDDAAFTVATDRVMAIGALADETSPDSVNEGDIGIPRMSLDRKLLVKAEQTFASTGQVHFQDTQTAIANAATGTITYTVTAGKTFFLKGVIAASSGAPCKVTVDYGTGPTTVAIGFYSSASPTLQFTFPEPVVIAAGEVVNVKIQNNAGSAQDVYATIIGLEV